MHSNLYRNQYQEFLSIDFPKIPFTDDENLFKELALIGEQLIQHHLLKNSYANSISKINGTGDNFKVEKIEYKNNQVWINSERYYEPVDNSIWDFRVGGYQVLEKWLKERKKNELSLTTDDILHFIKCVSIIDITLKTMDEIDELVADWI